MRVRTVFDLGTDAIYLHNHEMLLVDADLTEAEHDEAVRIAEFRYFPQEGSRRRRHLRAL